jgi:hypothetical protein
MFTHKQEEANRRQNDLTVILSNFQKAPHPERDQIQTLNNKLDK